MQDMQSEDEPRQIARAASGDRAAMRTLVTAHSPAIYALAFRMLHRAEDAEDVTQETFLRAWKMLPRWRPDAKLSTWLYRVALNLCHDRLRKPREALFAEPPERADTDTLAPDAQLRKSQRQAALSHAMAKLPDRQRAALTLTALQGQTNKEAADIMAISVEAIESLLARARRSLKKTLGPMKEIL